MMLALPEHSITTMNVIHNMDALALLRALPAGSVDAIITDMPYGTTACTWDTPVDLVQWWEQVKRVLKARGVFVTTAKQPFTSALVMSNLAMFKYEIIWNKGRGKMANYAMIGDMPGSIHENILVFSVAAIPHNSALKMTYNPVGAKPINKITMFNTGGSKGKSHRPGRIAKQVVGEQKYTGYPVSVVHISSSFKSIHPTQKPVALYEYLIQTYTRPGKLVVDPFSGSGTTALAARKTGRNFICGDFTREYVELARQRLAQSDPFMHKQVTPELVQRSMFAGISV